MGTKVIMYMVHRKPVLATGSWHEQYGSFLRNGENIVMVPQSAGNSSRVSSACYRTKR